MIDVPLEYLQAGTNTITVEAGPFINNEYGEDNTHDDFTFRTITLMLDK